MLANETSDRSHGFSAPRSGFAIGTGHCGTHLLFELLSAEPDVEARHESNPVNETFHRFCQWNQLPVDEQGFIETKRREMDSARRNGALYFEASSYLSLSVQSLYEEFSSRFVLLTRDPVDVVNSLWVKGWYAEPPVKSVRESSMDFAVGYQGTGPVHHFLGRIVPRGSEFVRWYQLTRIGKLAWFWNTLNLRVVQQFELFPPHISRVQKLERLNYESYGAIAQHLQLESRMSPEVFESIVAGRPGTSLQHHHLSAWTEQEVDEFCQETTEARERFGYLDDYRRLWTEVNETSRSAAHRGS